MTLTPLYSRRLAPCGCRGLPDGQHLAGCDRHRATEAPECRRCGYRAATEGDRCTVCGTSRETVPPAPAAPMLLGDAELEHPFGPGIEAPERLHWLRTATEGPYRLDLWDIGESGPGGDAELAYRLCVAEGARWILVFAGEGFVAPGSEEPNSDAALGAIVGFCSLRPGEADPALFARYTERQLAFAREHGEALALWAEELAGGGS
jgi:hypothetical protein